jgi:hypothetical protein
MTYRLKLNQVKEVLGMEITFEAIKLADGTIIEVEKFEPGFAANIVAEDGTLTLAPAGEHTLEDGRYIEVDENGIIMEISQPEAEEEIAEEEVVEVAGSKKFEDAVIEAPVMDVAMADMIEAKCEELIKDKIEEKMKMIFEVVDEVASEVATIKEEMGAFKAKFEKFAKAPATAGPNKVNMPNVTTAFDSFENKVAILKNAMK